MSEVVVFVPQHRVPQDYAAALNITAKMPAFGDAGSQDKHLRKVEFARQAARSLFSVAPNCAVTVGNQTFRAGDVLEAPTPAHVSVFRQLANRGAIIAIDQDELDSRRSLGEAAGT